LLEDKHRRRQEIARKGGRGAEPQEYGCLVSVAKRKCFVAKEEDRSAWGKEKKTMHRAVPTK